jgi:hypothetical protein
MESLEIFVQRDIDKRMQRCWKRLDRCFQWRLLKDFIDQKDLLMDLDESRKAGAMLNVRQSLLNGSFNDAVEYDTQLMKITCLNQAALAIIIQ